MMTRVCIYYSYLGKCNDGRACDQNQYLHLQAKNQSVGPNQALDQGRARRNEVAEDGDREVGPEVGAIEVLIEGEGEIV